MSELTLTIIKLGFLALLWLFVFSVASAIRTDVFGVRPPRNAAPTPKAAKPAKPAKPSKQARNAPTRLVVVDGPDKDRWVPLGEAPVVIGRGSDCTLALADDYVSTRHARVVPHDGRWYVEDLGSTNGTYVAGSRLVRAVAAETGTTVKMGKTVLELRK